MVDQADENYRRERYDDGWFDLNRDEQGIWRISILPDHEPGQPPSRGRTYSPGDSDLPP